MHAPTLGASPGEALRRIEAQEKREQLRNTLVWGGLIAGGVAWMAWPKEETGMLLYTRSDCERVDKVELSQCQSAFDQAMAEHERLAPRFDDRYQCDEQFGNCMPAPGNALYWIPPMAGFLLGYRQRDDDDGASGGGYYGGYRYTGALPLYRERSGDYLNPKGDYVSSGYGKVTGRAGNPSPPARAITISRSGFGSVAGARSSFGG
ncbi:DUF1190 domain-containing protein [Lysobacter humi (ex Lee et al. 2017)]